jgi:glucose-6-phosphate 1-dehydrogenase
MSFLIQPISIQRGNQRRQPEPSIMVIFGASGDLTHRKLIPALYRLHCKGRLPAGFSVVGYSRTIFNHAGFRDEMRQAIVKFGEIEIDDRSWQEFAERIYYCPGDISKAEDFDRLDQFLNQLQAERVGSGNRIYYLSLAPQFYEQVVIRLGEHAMAHAGSGWRRIVVEKPFGRDLDSAENLNRIIHSVFAEEQIYRIDHYLGKETAQNILFFRFANTIFEPVWNRNYVDHVQINVAESVDIGHRAGYYEHAGVLRDIFQNHLLQLLALLTMEPPASFNADLLRNEITKVLASIHPISPAETATNTVRGQYIGYRQEEGVRPDSETPTYAALRLFIDNWRWQGVPFYLRSGKALADKSTQIILQFKPPPHVMFPMPPEQDIMPNRLVMCIQPDEGIMLRFEAKVPDTIAEMRSVIMNFDYATTFGSSSIPDAYERLLLDVLQGDASLFTRSDAILLSWALMDPILAGWEELRQPPLVFYPRGSWGPTEADAFIGQTGRKWLLGCD